MSSRTQADAFEWPTLLLLAGCYAVWAVATIWLADYSLLLAITVLTVLIALHSSLTHEMVHGHPFRTEWLNELLVFPCLSLFVPYRRFRDLHLAHHEDSVLTDPYDDPESNYMDPDVWDTLPNWVKVVLRFNNTLFGRLIVGPAVGLVAFLNSDIRAMRDGVWSVTFAWLLQVPSLALVLGWLIWVEMPIWAYLLAAYAGFSILKIRTFLEHQAHERASGRTVVIEDRGPLAWIFLNNNLHVVHHMHPKVAWYRLPGLWDMNKEKYLTRNGGYHYRSYTAVFRKYFLQAKDPVPHPLWSRK